MNVKNIQLHRDTSRGPRSGYFETFALTPSEANIIPIWHLVLVDADSSSTSIGASIQFRNTTYSDTSIGDWILGECSNFLQHSLWRANSLTHKNVIRSLLPASSTFDSLFLSMSCLHSKCLTRNQDRNSCADQGPPYLNHCCYTLSALSLLLNSQWGSWIKRNRLFPALQVPIKVKEHSISKMKHDKSIPKREREREEPRQDLHPRIRATPARNIKSN